MKKTLITLGTISLITGCGDLRKEPADSSHNNDGVEKVEVVETNFPDLANKAHSMFGELPEFAENPDNKITPEKIALGKTLFYDTRLSLEGNISCNSCHNLSTYGVDNKSTSQGDNGGFGDRNSPTVYNAALHFVQFWDGRAADVEEQAGGPILNPVEMAIPDKDFLIKRLSDIKGYKPLFAAAFPGEKNPLTYDNIQKSIGAFERTLITPTRFDEYMAGKEDALSEDEKAGLDAFINAGCISCHMGSNLGGSMFQKFGVYGNYWELTGSEKIDEGKFAVTGQDYEKYMFKVPSLRNIEKTSPYFHDGSVSDLKEAIKIMAKLQLNKDLTDEEVTSIVTFLKTLTAEIDQEKIAEPEMPQ